MLPVTAGARCAAVAAPAAMIGVLVWRDSAVSAVFSGLSLIHISVGSSAADFAKFVDAEQVRWAEVVKTNNITVN